MAATRGPVPKRSDERRRRNQDDGPVTKAAGAVVVRQPAADRGWHPIAKRWFESLGRSGQVVFFEPSDWAQAVFVAESMSRLLSANRFSAQLFAAVESATARLMTTEADRRRLRIELEREAKGADPDEVAGVTSIAAWQAKLAEQG